jgi:hypothetical protein
MKIILKNMQLLRLCKASSRVDEGDHDFMYFNVTGYIGFLLILL